MSHSGNFASNFQHLSSSGSCSFIGGDLLLEVLSRLPVKSLMRFKCVCKLWLSIIKNDPYFIDLHFRRSKTRPALILNARILSTWERYFLSADLPLPSEVTLEGGEATCQGQFNLATSERCDYIYLVNGIFCFVNKRACSVRIYNPSTREATPYITSIVKQQQPQLEAEGNDNLLNHIRLGNLGWFQFGYDPATKEHKVISLWSKVVKDGPFIRYECICEVLTVGRQNNSWRKIDDFPPATPSDLTSSAYANGSIYWLNRGLGYNKDHEPCILEFKVGSEKFRTIQLPKFILDDVRYPYRTDLMELDGRLALLPKKIKSCDDSSDTHLNNNITSLKMCVLCTDDDYDYDDDDDQDAMSTSSSSSRSSSRSSSSIGNYYWMEETFSLPPFDWQPGIPEFIRPIPGTDLLIIRPSYDLSFYYYNWKRKSFSSSKCEINGIHTFLIPPCEMIGKDSPIGFGFYAFTENLSPVK